VSITRSVMRTNGYYCLCGTFLWPTLLLTQLALLTILL